MPLRKVEKAQVWRGWKPSDASNHFYGTVGNTYVTTDYNLQVGIKSIVPAEDSLDSSVGGISKNTTSSLPQRLANPPLFAYMATDGVAADSYTVPPMGESVSQTS